MANKAHVPRVTSRDDTLSSPWILAQEKVVTCCVAVVGQHGTTRLLRQARHARHVFRGVATAWTAVDVSLFPEVVPEIDANPEHKELNCYTRALLLVHRPPCWNKHGTTRATCRACLSVAQQVEFSLNESDYKVRVYL